MQARAVGFETLELGLRLAWLGVKNTFLNGASIASFRLVRFTSLIAKRLAIACRKKAVGVGKFN